MNDWHANMVSAHKERVRVLIGQLAAGHTTFFTPRYGAVTSVVYTQHKHTAYVCGQRVSGKSARGLRREIAAHLSACRATLDRPES